MLGIEPTGFDQSVISFRDQIGFDHAGLDLSLNGDVREDVRAGFSYYSGFPAATTPSRVPTGQRRRFVILDGQPGASQWEVRHVAADFSSSQANAVRAVIDSIPGPSTVEPSLVTVSTTVIPPEAATISGGGEFMLGAAVPLSLTANPGYRFVEWQGNVSDASDTGATLIPETDTTITAVFVRQWSLALAAVPGGTLFGAGTYDEGAVVTIEAVPDSGYRFAQWQGAAVENPLSETTTISLTEALSVTAVFVRVLALELSANNVEGGSVSGAGIYDEGSVV